MVFVVPNGTLIEQMCTLFSDPRSDRLVIGSLVGYYLHPMVVNFGSLCVLALSPDPSHVWYSLLGILRPSERSG